MHASEQPGRTPVSADPRHGWLAVLLPADAYRLSVPSPELAATLAAAGFELVERGADVEIAAGPELTGTAPVALVTLQAREPTAPSRPRRALQRLARAATLRARAASARLRLARLGYGRRETLAWERTEPLVRSPSGGGPLAHRLPLNVVLVGARRPRGPTILEAAAGAAAEQTGHHVTADAPVVGSSGVVVVPGAEAVLRVALGRARDVLEGHVRALAGLGAGARGAGLAERVPRLQGSGELRHAAWSLEERLPGSTPVLPLDAALMHDCVEFLVELHCAGSGAPPVASAAAATAVATLCGGAYAGPLATLAECADAELAAMPRGFGHGDMWSGNLLAREGRLTGVIDWAAAGPGRLPLLDLLHLRVSELRDLHGVSLGPALLRFRAVAANDPTVRAYAARLGLALDEREHAALLVAYWLDALARELSDPDRADQQDDPAWRRANIDGVVSVLRTGLVTS